MENKMETAKAFELRNLTADDMFPMFQIISKIGMKEFKHCFESDSVKSAVSAAAQGKDADITAIGMTVVFDLAGVIFANIGNCKDDIYKLLSQLSGLSVKEIAKLPMNTFMEMIVEVIKKDEFKDFFKGAAKLFK